MDIQVRGRKIHVKEPHGEGTERDPAFLLIHGAGGDSSSWGAQAEYFRGKHPVYRLELPGHGRSSPPGEEEISAYTAWVRTALEQIVPHRPYLLGGHSMGGAVVLELATDPPPGLAGIVLAGTGARLIVMPAIFEMLEKDPEAFYATIDLAAFHGDTPPGIREPLIRAIRNSPLSVLRGDFKACNHFNVKERLKGIRLPTLILCGEGDRLTSPKLSAFLHEQVPGSQLVIIPEAGHMVMAEQPETVNRALEGFAAERWP